VVVCKLLPLHWHSSVEMVQLLSGCLLVALSTSALADNVQASAWDAAKLKVEAFLTSPLSFVTGARKSLQPVASPLRGGNPLQAAASDASDIKVKVGDPIPDVKLDLGFPPEKFDLAGFAKGKKIVLVGLPGAFTPT